MSAIARKQIAAIRQYKAEHPEVDWTANMVRLQPDPPSDWDEDTQWVAIGHSPNDWPERDRWC